MGFHLFCYKKDWQLILKTAAWDCFLVRMVTFTALYKGGEKGMGIFQACYANKLLGLLTDQLTFVRKCYQLKLTELIK